MGEETLNDAMLMSSRSYRNTQMCFQLSFKQKVALLSKGFHPPSWFSVQKNIHPQRRDI